MRALARVVILTLSGLLLPGRCPAEEARLSVYQPEGLSFADPASQWSTQRSAESDHFVLFWEAGFGEDPSSNAIPEDMRVDVSGLLDIAEEVYRTNTETLGFRPPAGQSSWLDRYKLEIFLLYQEDWVAVGSGYDDVIGALWVSPMACRPAGATVAHEIGHCFQYQVYADRLLNGAADDGHTGFRYAYGGGLGNAFWELCAEWQAFQDYPEDAFPDWYRDGWAQNAHRAPENEWSRYQSYWFLYAFAELRGQDAVGRLWRESAWPEDALAAYRRLFCEDDPDALAADLYWYASHAATWDLEACRAYADAWIDCYETVLYPDADGWLRVGYASCPDDGGFNVIRFDPADYSGTLTLEFETLPEGSPLAPDDPGVWHKGAEEELTVGVTRAFDPAVGEEDGSGHRYGFVILCSDGTRRYGEMRKEGSSTVTCEIPEDAEAIYFVVVGAAAEHVPHVWDEDGSTDRQLPYRIRIVEGGA